MCLYLAAYYHLIFNPAAAVQSPELANSPDANAKISCPNLTSKLPTARAPAGPTVAPSKRSTVSSGSADAFAKPPATTSAIPFLRDAEPLLLELRRWLLCL